MSSITLTPDSLDISFTASEKVAGLVRDAMEHAFPLDVPLTVDVGVGPNWKAAKP